MKANRKTARAARALYRACLVNGSLEHERARTITRRLAASGGRRALATLTAFHRLVQLDHDRHTARVESAAPLAEPMRAGIGADLVRLYGPQLQIEFTENPALLGGVRITVASDVYDGSLQGRLAALEARL